ncbi:GPI ethanolamine phosphate transferase 1-like isoform X2 [Zootermopsis nevadensis]|uniref:GPI ethanolamine phosphate transferase 1-like isoform X2 n=1 Tax=Zootermopsis nevadensis TaxID=136037 RepID=UPI000B8EAABE|nr:GPI ethanolamine phosphate transferase 1-like isoform X2 [Zootermopsis nevadensis]
MFLIFSVFVVHVVFLVSVFDIYFKSPIVHGMTPQSSPLEPPARRLVLMVADGLRADFFFEADDLKNKRNAPHLRSIIEERGVWGVSHTRVPTESRPGHVALIAGLYEDPSAVAKGWKENPVEFDSVFNESRYTWSWGSPDILPMFAKGASGNHVYIDTYEPEVEDFGGRLSTSRLDTWVFRKVEEFLNYAKTDAALNEKLHQDRIVFFLHLLGLDTAGHTHKPHSVEYKENIKIVDAGIKKIEEIIEEFYHYDKKTAYVFTADHGMTDWGSHGAGDRSETETPLVAWGAGVREPRPSTGSNPPSPASWGLGHLTRSDVNQADVAPLMASLIGVPVPVNSVGILPRDYLGVTEHKLSELMFSNARQMAAQYNKKRELAKAGALSWIYREFSLLSENKETELMDQIHSHISAKRYIESIAVSEKLISLSLLGLEYYQNYYQHFLLSCITIAFLGWIAWLLLSLVDDMNFHRKNSLLLDVQHEASKDKKMLNLIRSRICAGGRWVNITFMFLVILTVMLIFLQMLSRQFYIYCLLPELIWWAVARHWAALRASMFHVRDLMGLRRLLMLFIFHVIGIEILVVSFFYRYFLSIGMLGLAAWPVIFPLDQSVQFPLLAGWVSSCLFLAVFPLLPVVGREPNTQLVALSGWLFLILVAYCAWRLETCAVDSKDRFHSCCVVAVQLVMLPTAIWDLVSTAENIKNKQGLPGVNQFVSWSLLDTTVPFIGLQGDKKKCHADRLSC